MFVCRMCANPPTERPRQELCDIEICSDDCGKDYLAYVHMVVTGKDLKVKAKKETKKND